MIGASGSAGNIIAGNQTNGVFIGVGLLNTGSSNNWVRGNQIGYSGFGNGAGGVYIKGSSWNSVGGTNNGDGNWIAYNGASWNLQGHGVVVESGTNNPILGNLIWTNSGRGIDLGNDSFDIPHLGNTNSGPNNRQNYPVPIQVYYDRPHGWHEITWALTASPATIIGSSFSPIQL